MAEIPVEILKVGWRSYAYFWVSPFRWFFCDLCRRVTVSTFDACFIISSGNFEHWKEDRFSKADRRKISRRIVRRSSGRSHSQSSKDQGVLRCFWFHQARGRDCSRQQGELVKKPFWRNSCEYEHSYNTYEFPLTWTGLDKSTLEQRERRVHYAFYAVSAHFFHFRVFNVLRIVYKLCLFNVDVPYTYAFYGASKKMFLKKRLGKNGTN